MQFYGDLTFLGVYLLGLFFIPSWRKKKKEHDWLPWMFGWTVFMFFSYVLYLEIIRGTAFFLIPIAFLACLRSSTSRKKAFTEWNII